VDLAVARFDFLWGDATYLEATLENLEFSNVGDEIKKFTYIFYARDLAMYENLRVIRSFQT
jgi:hypothetical protein